MADTLFKSSAAFEDVKRTGEHVTWWAQRLLPSYKWESQSWVQLREGLPPSSKHAMPSCWQSCLGLTLDEALFLSL